MGITILKDLFINVCILVTIIYIGSQIFMGTGLGRSSPLKVKIQLGIIGAFLGIMLMLFSIKIPPDSLIDLRNIAIIIITIYSGGLATVITGIILVIFRLLYQGISPTSIIAACTLLALTGVCVLIGKSGIRKSIQWIYMFCCSGIVTSIGLALTIKNSGAVNYIIIYYWAGSLFATVVAYVLTEYLARTYILLKRLKEESTVDFLTGLKNTRSFDTLFDTLLEKAIMSGEKVSVLMLDIDFFKKVNDIHGHAAGDMVLKQLGELLSKTTRDFAAVARIGGEEFCAVLIGCSRVQTLEIAERIRKTVENYTFYLPYGDKLNITISIGCSVYPDTVVDLQKIKEIADMKLYETKQAGRNKVYI